MLGTEGTSFAHSHAGQLLSYGATCPGCEWESVMPLRLALVDATFTYVVALDSCAVLLRDASHYIQPRHGKELCCVPGAMLHEDLLDSIHTPIPPPRTTSRGINPHYLVRPSENDRSERGGEFWFIPGLRYIAGCLIPCTLQVTWSSHRQRHRPLMSCFAILIAAHLVMMPSSGSSQGVTIYCGLLPNPVQPGSPIRHTDTEILAVLSDLTLRVQSTGPCSRAMVPPRRRGI
nr:hypothetical protein CFP56_16706 [Quercus suber]